MYIYIYIYIYRKREREREGERDLLAAVDESLDDLGEHPWLGVLVRERESLCFALHLV